MKKKVTDKLIYNNNFIRVLSVLTAIMFWFIVVINVSPDYKRSISGAKINLEENMQSLTSLGLHPVDKSSDKVTITVTGPRNVIGRLTPESFTVIPNLGVISKAGNYELQLSAVLKTPDNRVRITQISPSYVTVKFDTMQVKNLAVNILVENNKVPDGYIMQTAVSNPKTVAVTGPTTELSQVVKAQARVKVNDDATQTVTENCKLVLLDSQGRELSLKHVQLSTSSVKVTVPILKTKKVPFKVDFSNIPQGFDKSNIEYQVSPSTILVAGAADRIDTLKEINLGSIDFSKLDLNTVQAMNVPDIEGIMNVENIQSVDVSVKLKNISSKLMNTGNFATVNVPNGYTVAVRTKQINNIKLFGPSSDINSVSSITAVIDLSNVEKGTGQYEVPVTFSVPGKSGYWVTGSYTAVVSIKKS